MIYTTRNKKSSWARTISVIGFLTIFLGTQPLAVQGDCGGPIAEAVATCHFTQAVNESLDLTATPWFQRSFNDSWTWEHNNTLTWAFDPNLAFWTFFQDELVRIATDLSSNLRLREVMWSLPLTDPAADERVDSLGPILPIGFIIDWNNGSYEPFSASGSPVYNGEHLVENLTFVLSGQWDQWEIVPLQPEEWIARVAWTTEGSMSDAEWNALAETVSARLNASWHVKSCIFPMAYPDCGAAWPFEAILLGLLILVGLRSKGWYGQKKRDYC